MTTSPHTTDVRPAVVQWLVENNVRPIAAHILIVLEQVKADIMRAFPTLKEDKVLRDGVWDYVNGLDDVMEYAIPQLQRLAMSVGSIHQLMKAEAAEILERMAKEGSQDESVVHKPGVSGPEKIDSGS